MNLVVSILLLTISSCILVSSQFTRDEIQQILERINTVRRNANPTGSNLREVMWSECLANISARYLMECSNFGEQNQEREAQAREAGCVTSDVSVGETRFNDATDSANPVDAWASENSSYNFEMNTCQGECSNYLQLVNAETFLVGCANLNEFEECGREGESTVCNYAFAPDGNAPYQAGEACADCEGDFSGCNEGLCVGTPATTVVTTNPATVVTTNPASPSPTTPNCPNPKDHRHHHHHHGHKHGRKHGRKHDKKGHRSHDHDKCDKKHGYESAEISVGNFADAGYNNSAINNRVMIFLLTVPIIAILLSIL